MAVKHGDLRAAHGHSITTASISPAMPALSNRIIRQAVELAGELKVKLEMDWAKPVYFDEDKGQVFANVSEGEAKAATHDNQPLSPKSCDSPWKWILIQNNGYVQTC